MIPANLTRTYFLKSLITISCFVGSASAETMEIRALSQQEITEVGQKIWSNECEGRIDQLVYWKEGEQWPSVGIGHFIWPPENYKGAFKEGGFHQLLSFFAKNGIKIPSWVGRYSPWKNEKAFRKDTHRRQELQELMLATIPLQAEFIVHKLSKALPSLTSELKPEEQARFTSNVNELLNTPSGTFALIDYLNFKGSGIAEHEHYQGHRWGLLQVILEMRGHGEPVDRFIDSAKMLLRRRVAHADKSRNEGRWIPGWFARLERYR